MENQKVLEKLIEGVREDSKRALGCTEPVAISYAAYEAGKYVKEKIEKVEVFVSKNIFKNAKSVKIPNTEGRSGMDLAVAIGLLTEEEDIDPSLVFRNLTQERLQEVLDLVEKGIISVEYVENVPDIYILVKVQTKSSMIESTVSKKHTRLEKLVVNGETVFSYEEEEKTVEKEEFDFTKISVSFLKEIVDEADVEDLLFTLEGVEINLKAAEEGLKGYNNSLGKTLNELKEKGILEDNMITETRILTAAAADMRMGGGECEVMTSGGSGNQGVGVILPIAIVAKYEKIDDEKLARSLFFAHSLNRYIKEFSGKLSGMCGCAIGAAIGATAGISYLLGGSVEEISGACSNIFANLSGMICDGAKESCSMKLSTCAEESIISAYLALEGMITANNVGMVGETIEETILNVGKLSREAFRKVDDTILQVMNREGSCGC